MRARWMVVGLVVLFAFALSFAEEHYVCKKVGDLDKWGVPRWKQEKLFSNGVVMYIDIYDDHAEVKAERDGIPYCIAKAPGCTEECTSFDCVKPCTCNYISCPPDATKIKETVNKVVDKILQEL